MATSDQEIIDRFGEHVLTSSTLPSKVFAMWLFLASDAVTFGAILYAYGYLRNASIDWPTPFHLAVTGTNVALMTFVLVTSSLTMSLAVHQARRGARKAAIGWMFATALLGMAFAVLHAREWMGLIHEGMTPAHNPWGAPLFGAGFFVVTGMHLLHVVVGIVILAMVAAGYGRGRYNAHDLEVCGMYWHFVDVVWMFVVPIVYLLNIQR